MTNDDGGDLKKMNNNNKNKSRLEGGDIYKVNDVKEQHPEFYEMLDFQIQELLREVDADNDIINTEEIRGIFGAICDLLDDIDEAMTATK